MAADGERLITALIGALVTIAIAVPVVAEPDRESAVLDWLRATLPASPAASEAASPTQVVLAWSDLNGDGRDEAIAYVSGTSRCGTGGCNLYVLERHAAGLTLRGRTSVTRPPVRVLPTGAHGWRDLSVTVCGGSELACRAARLRFDGTRYAANPSLEPAPSRDTRAETLIPAGALGRDLISEDQPHHVPEYGLAAWFPRGARVCPSISGTRLQGWYMPLGGACEPLGRRVSVTAAYNAHFAETPEEASFCLRSGGRQVRIGLTLQDLPSFTCQQDLPDGAIIINLTAQGGRRWIPEDRSPEWRTAAINYSVRLHTDAEHLQRDAAVFERVVRRVEINTPDG